MSRDLCTAPSIISLPPLSLCDRCDPLGKWPLARNPDKSWWHPHTSLKVFFDHSLWLHGQQVFWFNFFFIFGFSRNGCHNHHNFIHTEDKSAFSRHVMKEGQQFRNTEDTMRIIYQENNNEEIIKLKGNHQTKRTCNYKETNLTSTLNRVKLNNPLNSNSCISNYQ